MSISRIEIERFSVTPSKPFEAVVAAFKVGVARLDLAAFAKVSKSSGNLAELEEVMSPVRSLLRIYVAISG
jgi:hypothetical protein